MKIMLLQSSTVLFCEIVGLGCFWAYMSWGDLFKVARMICFWCHFIFKLNATNIRGYKSYFTFLLHGFQWYRSSSFGSACGEKFIFNMEEEDISNLLLQTLQKISRYLKEMRHEGDSIGFFHEASTSTANGMGISAALQRSTMPSFLTGGDKEGTLGEYFE